MSAFYSVRRIWAWSARWKSLKLLLVIGDLDLDPRMHRNIDQTSEKLIFFRITLVATDMWTFFSASISAILLWRLGTPETPFVANTRGVNVPFLIWSTRSLYWHFFSFSFLSKHLFSSKHLYLWACRLKTLMSKNTLWSGVQKPRALISRRASGLVLAVRSLRTSLVDFHKWWFRSHVVTDLLKKGRSDVTELVMA